MSQSITSTLALHPNATMVEFDSRVQAKSYRLELVDGRHFQINETLFRLLEALRTPMSLETLQRSFAGEAKQAISSAEIETISSQLLAQGILIEDGKVPEVTKRRSEDASLLALHFRREFLSAKRLAPIVRPLRIFFAPPVALVTILLIALVHFQFYVQSGLSTQIDTAAVNWPLCILVLLATFFLHEFGHLAACQRWDCPHGPLGIGFYFFQPVFYVDVTAAWRLKIWQRAVVDMGGIYLQLVATILFWWLWLATQDVTWIYAILMSDLFAMSNLQPFMKLDGYWLLSDLSGIPNLHARVGAVLGYLVQRIVQGTLALIKRGSSARMVAPWAEWSKATRRTILVYLAISLIVWPMMLVQMVPMLIQLVLTTPTLWPAALSSLFEALPKGDIPQLWTSLQTLFVPILISLNFFVLGKQLVKKVMPVRRVDR